MQSNNGINVLSLFDGMSCGQIALQRSGIKVNQYFASEIDKYAIQVTQANYPDTIQLGDITNIKGQDLPKIDLIIGGSPCQGFSFAGKQLAFDDPRSKLFFEYVRLIKECNPSFYLLENVKMKTEYEIIISKYLGVAPIEINSALVSAQNRVRLYWTNIHNQPYGLFGDMQCMIPQPADKGILIKHILQKSVPEKYYLSIKGVDYVLNQTRIEKMYTQNAAAADKSLPHLAKSQANWTGDFVAEPYTKVSKRGYVKENQDKASTFTAGANSAGNHTDMDLILEENRTLVRRLTPIECERLQTVPDNYTNHVSDSQRYKMLGNGWTVDVVAHIFSFLPDNLK